MNAKSLAWREREEKRLSVQVTCANLSYKYMIVKRISSERWERFDT